jgi:preprotein translocase subunit SecA
MNDQRKLIYEYRNDIITHEHIENFIKKMLENLAESVIEKCIPKNSLREDWDIKQLKSEIQRLFAIYVDEEVFVKIEGAEEELTNFVINLVNQLLQTKQENYSKQLMHDTARYILIGTLDQLWKDHLHNLDHLRQGISLRSYGQKDPLNEYKKEAFELFEGMLEHLSELYLQRLCYMQLDVENIDRESIGLENKELQEMYTGREDPAFAKYNSGVSLETKAKPFKAYVSPDQRDPSSPQTWGKISRNESCPCGSGLKYKHCHGKI